MILSLSPEVRKIPAPANTLVCTSYVEAPDIDTDVIAVPEKAPVPVYFSNWIVVVFADAVSTLT